jgi:flagellar hook-length control protein FliK
MIATAPALIPSSSGVEPAMATRHGSDRSAAGSAEPVGTFERTLNDARERSDAGPRRSDHEGEPRSEKTRAADRPSATAAHVSSERGEAEAATAGTTTPAPSTSARSGSGSSAEATAATAAMVGDAAAAANDVVALVGGTVAGAGAVAASAAGPTAGTTNGLTRVTSAGTTLGGAPSASTAAAAVVDGAATGVPASGVEGRPGLATAHAASTAGQPRAASATASPAPVALTITVGETKASKPGFGAAASVGALAATTTTSTGMPGHPFAGPGGAADPTSPPSAGQLTPAAVAVPSSGAPAPAPTTAPAGSATISQWLQQAVQAQLTGRLVAAARGSEAGSVQRLTLHLHPADLGAVQVVATVDDGTVTLQLLAGNPATREALRASLGVLRSDLAAAGLDGTRLDVSDQPPGQQGAPQQQSGAGFDGSAGAFTGGTAGHATTAGRTHPGPVPSAVGADVLSRPLSRGQGVDLRL